MAHFEPELLSEPLGSLENALTTFVISKGLSVETSLGKACHKMSLQTHTQSWLLPY